MPSRLNHYLVIFLILGILLTGCQNTQPTPQATLVPTPFQPLAPTPTARVVNQPTRTQPSTAIPSTATIVPAPRPEFSEIDFGDTAAWITLIITPPNPQVNQGRPIRIKFLPGDTCDFGTHHGCVSIFSTGQSNVIFVSVHSGMGGEGQDFRNAVEGTGINTAWFSLDQVAINLTSLAGATVTLSQSGHTLTGLELAHASRVPAHGLKGYLNVPVESAISYASAYDHALDAYLPAPRPILVFETCGWRMLSENWDDAVSDTTASVYLGIVQPR